MVYGSVKWMMQGGTPTGNLYMDRYMDFIIYIYYIIWIKYMVYYV